MSDKEQFVNLVGALLSTDNETRNSAAATLNEASKNSPDQFVNVTLDIIRDESIDVSIRSSAVILLKKKLVINPTTDESIYYQLSDPMKDYFRREIMIALSNIQLKRIVDQIADLVADVAGSILSDDSVNNSDDEKWPNLVPHLFELFSTKSEMAMASVLSIFEGLFLVISDKMIKYSQQLYSLFEAGLSFTSTTVRVAALESVCTLVESSKAKDVQPFKNLRDLMLVVINDLLNTNDEDNLQVAISRIFDICETEPAFMKTKFNELCVVMSDVRAKIQDPDSNLKIEAVESLVFLLERYPDLVKSNKQRLEKVVEMIFMMMMEVEDEVDDHWKSPPDGFNDDLEEDDDQKLIKTGMDFIDRLITHIGKEYMLKFLSEVVNKMLFDANWKMRHAALMAISQVGEYMIDNFEEVTPIIGIIHTNINDANPRIRYACCHCIGQFADDLAPEFQNKFHNDFFTIILPRLDDPVPRVVAHSLAAFTNFLESCNSEQVAPYFTTLYQKIIGLLLNGIVYVKEACLSTLSALCEGAPDLFKPTLPEILGLIFNVLEAANKPEFNELIGNAIECATIIAKVYGADVFAPYSERLIQDMIKVQAQSVQVDGADPQKSYIIAGWQRLCITLGDKLLPYIDNIMPDLLKIADEPMKGSNEGGTAKTTDYERAEIAVQMINVFLESMGSGLGKFVEPIYNYTMSVCNSYLNDDIKLSAMGLLPGIVKIYKANYPDHAAAFSKDVISKMWVIIDNENDPVIIAEELFNMQKVLKYAGKIFSQEELGQILVKCEEHMKKSENRKEEILDAYDTEEETAEDLEMVVNADKDSEDDLKLEIANVFGILFRTHKVDALNLFQHIYQNHISIAFANEKHLKSVHYGIFLVDDALEHLGEFLSQEVIINFMHLLLKYTLHQELDIRQSSVFGIGLVAQILKENFHPYFEEVVKIITQSIDIPKNENDINKQYHTCRENAISTFGKVLMVSWGQLTPDRLQIMVDYWINHLPITHDAKEAIIQHNMLMQALVTNYSIILGPQMKNLKAIIHTFQIIYKHRKVSNQNINDSIQEIVRAFVNNEQIKSALENLGLSDEEKTFIQSAVNPTQ